MDMASKSCCLATILALAACVHSPGAPDAGTPVPDGGGHAEPEALLRCAAAGAGAVTSIAQVVDRLNALPHPVTGPCLVASLPRPLSVVATLEANSAQPAEGPHDPRVFLMPPGLVIAVVSSGTSARLLELGEWMTATTTLKGEIALPVTRSLESAEPFARLAAKKTDGVTSCGLCHESEVAHPSVPYGHVSAAFRPKTEVKLEALAAEHQACVTRHDASARCDLFHALFDFGALEQGAFADGVGYFVQ